MLDSCADAITRPKFGCGKNTMASLRINFGMLHLVDSLAKLHYNKLYFMRFIHVPFPYFAYAKCF